MQSRLRELIGKGSIYALAKAIGVSESVFSNFFAGKANLGLNVLVKVAQYYKVSLDWLVFGKETELKPLREENIRLRNEIEQWRETADTLRKVNIELLKGVKKKPRD